KFAVDIFGQYIQLFGIIGCILFVLRRMFRIAFAQNLGHITNENLAILRVEPEVEVEFGMVVVLFGFFSTFLCVVMGIVRASSRTMVMTRLTMLFVLMTFIAMIMCLEWPPFAAFELRQSIGFAQRYNFSALAQGIEWLIEKSLHRRPGPEDDLRVLDGLGIRWFEAVRMFRPCTLNDQFWLTDTLHHSGNQGMQWFDRNDNAAALGGRSRPTQNSHKCGCQQQGSEVFHDIFSGSLLRVSKSEQH